MRLKSELVPSVNSSSPRDVVAGGAGFGGVSSGVESCASPSSPSSSLAGGRQPRSKMCLAAKRAGIEGMRSHPFQGGEEGNELGVCASILSDIMAMKEAAHFLRPVDPVRDQVPTYFTFISRPMDLGTISANLKAGIYKTATEMRMDLHLVWKNCLVFNGNGSPIYLQCRKLADRFDSSYRAKIHPTRHQGQKTKFFHGEGHVGTRVCVYWQDDHEWYPGHLDLFNGDKGYHIKYDDGEEEWLTMPSVDVCAIDSTVSLDEGGRRALGGGIARGSGGDESKRQLQRDSSGSPGDIAYMPQILPGGSHTTPSVGSNTGEAGDDSASGPASEDEELPPHAAQCQCRECKERKRSSGERVGKEGNGVMDMGEPLAVPFDVDEVTIHDWGRESAGKLEGGIISIGYRVKRQWRSPLVSERGSTVMYECTVEDGGVGKGPVFAVCALVEPPQRWEGATPSEPWVKAARSINKKLNTRLTEVVSGSHLFGLTIPQVADVLERMYPSAAATSSTCTNLDSCSAETAKRSPSQKQQQQQGGGGGGGAKARRRRGSEEPSMDFAGGKRPKKSQDESLQVCIEILQEVMAAQDAKHFLSPVDPESDGLPDYLTYIDTPMDLGTILEKATGGGGHYTTPHDIYCDVITVWRNCLIYFTETSPRYRSARKLARQFEASYKTKLQPPRQQGIESFTHGASWIGCAVQVHWRDDHQWYSAVIDNYQVKSGSPSYHVTYDDGEEEWIFLPSVDVYLDPKHLNKSHRGSTLISGANAESNSAVRRTMVPGHGTGYVSGSGSAQGASGRSRAAQASGQGRGVKMGGGSKGAGKSSGQGSEGSSLGGMSMDSVAGWLKDIGLGGYARNFQDACIDGDALSKMRDMALSHEAGGMPVFLALCKDELGMSRVGHVLKLARKLQGLGL